MQQPRPFSEISVGHNQSEKEAVFEMIVYLGKTCKEFIELVIKQIYGMEVTNHDIFAATAFEKIEKKVFGTTQQLLEIHSCQYEGNLPRIVGIMEDKNVAKVYFQ